MKRYAIADEVPEDCDYITVGKEYEVIDIETQDDIEIFETVADDGITTYFNMPPAYCDLLQGTWRIVEKTE